MLKYKVTVISQQIHFVMWFRHPLQGKLLIKIPQPCMVEGFARLSVVD